MKLSFTVIFACFFFCLSQGLGQVNEVVVERNFQDSTFVSFSQWMSQEKGVAIYFADKWVQDVRITSNTSGKNVREILSKALEDTKLELIEESANIFVLLPKRSSKLTWTTKVVEDKPIASVVKDKLNVEESPTQLTRRKTSLQTFVVGTEDGRRKDVYKVNGFILNSEDKTAVKGVVLTFDELKLGAFGDSTGYFEINLPEGLHRFSVEAAGMEPLVAQARVLGDGEIEIILDNEIRQLGEVLIEANRLANVQSTEMGVSRVSIKRIEQLPKVLGDVDVVKAAVLLPGVQTVGEGSSGFNVRGGSVDQNLIRINEAPVFNPSHMFGFFSAFNPDMIQNFDLYKSAIPARFGGRLSSIMDIGLRDGNNQRWEAKGGISPITLRFTVEGPIKKNKSSFLLGGRTTYSDWLLNRLENPFLRNSSANFGDLNGKITLAPSEKDFINASFYVSQDFFLLNGDTSFTYYNTNGSLIWKHIFNPRLLNTNSLIFSQYSFDIRTRRDPISAFSIGYGIGHYEYKSDWAFSLNSKHQMRWGLTSIFYRLQPGQRSARGIASLVSPLELETEQGLESAIYFSDEFQLSPRIKLYGGLRFSMFNFLGPNKVYDYLPEAPLSPNTIVDSTSFGNGNLIQTYAGPEFRFSSRFLLDENTSIKLGYHRMRQYLHVLSNTTSFAPTDTWKLSDPYIRPQLSDQLALGLYKNFLQNTIETSVEVYAKRVQNILDFKGGAQLVLNPFVETEILSGEGRGYGAEFLFRKNGGKLTGWVSYTYSRIFTRIQGDFIEETINNGQWFPATVDRPHDFSLVGSYTFSRRFSISTNVAYSTGRPITYPIGQYQLGSSPILAYSLRNQFRVPDYFRWDLAVNLEGNHKKKKLIDSSWSLSVYNVLGRRNPFSIFFVSGTSGIQGYKLSVFGRPIVTLTYNFKIR